MNPTYKEKKNGSIQRLDLFGHSIFGVVCISQCFDFICDYTFSSVFRVSIFLPVFLKEKQMIAKTNTNPKYSCFHVASILLELKTLVLLFCKLSAYIVSSGQKKNIFNFTHNFSRYFD